MPEATWEWSARSFPRNQQRDQARPIQATLNGVVPVRIVEQSLESDGDCFGGGIDVLGDGVNFRFLACGLVVTRPSILERIITWCAGSAAGIPFDVHVSSRLIDTYNPFVEGGSFMVGVLRPAGRFGTALLLAGRSPSLQTISIDGAPPVAAIGERYLAPGNGTASGAAAQIHGPWYMAEGELVFVQTSFSTANAAHRLFASFRWRELATAV